MLLFLFMSVHLLGSANGLLIIGCPLYGCRPSGTFSMYLSVPLKNATIAWESKFAYDPVPRALGCVANDVNIICQSNGPFKEDKGYVCLDGWNGTISWRDKVLRFPTLPLMDNYGDVTGTDGISLVHYDQNGKLYPVISMKGTRPLYSLSIVSTHFMLIVSENGGLFVRELNAIPDASIFLNATVHGVKGTFITVSQPVVNESRFYILTKFVPDDPSKTIHVQRVYAMDIHDRMADIVTIAWYYQFDDTPEKGVRNGIGQKTETTENVERQKLHFRRHTRGMHEAQNLPILSQTHNLMWDGTNGLLYVIRPPFYNTKYPKADPISSFWALTDHGNSSAVAYRISSVSVNHMTMFEKNIYSEEKQQHNADKQVNKDTANPMWISLSSGRLLSLSSNGSVLRAINLSMILEANVEITSKLTTARANETTASILIMGVRFSDKSDKFISVMERYCVNMPAESITSAVIAVDAALHSSRDVAVMWVVPIPGNMTIKGQISGSAGASTRRKDRLIVYTEEEGKSAKVVAIE